MYFLFELSGLTLFPTIYVGWFVFGCISSGTSYVLCRLFDDEGLNIKWTRKE